MEASDEFGLHLRIFLFRVLKSTKPAAVVPGSRKDTKLAEIRSNNGILSDRDYCCQLSVIKNPSMENF